jgi:hypothetical protein
MTGQFHVDMTGQFHVDMAGQFHVDMTGQFHVDMTGQFHVDMTGQFHVDMTGQFQEVLMAAQWPLGVHTMFCDNLQTASNLQDTKWEIMKILSLTLLSLCLFLRLFSCSSYLTPTVLVGTV